MMRAETPSEPTPPTVMVVTSPTMAESTPLQPAEAADRRGATPMSPAELTLWHLVGQIRDLAPELPSSTLSIAATRLNELAFPRASQDSEPDESAWPLAPERLSFPTDGTAGSGRGADEADARSECSEGSQPSRDPPLATVGSPDDEWHPEWDAWPGDAMQDLDDRPYVGWTPHVDLGFPTAASYHDPADDDETGHGRRFDRGGGRDSLGLAANARCMSCDYHDLHGGNPHACMAADVLQQPRISRLVEKLQRRHQQRPREDRDRGEARHTLYKAIIAWQWASPLGAENRVRLPVCVEVRVRRLFPNPCCCAADGCDFSRRCEQLGHYTGFRTAAESRALRDGL